MVRETPSKKEIVTVGGKYGTSYELAEGMTLAALKWRRKPRPPLCRFHLHYSRTVGKAWAPDFDEVSMIDAIGAVMAIGRKLKRCRRCGAVKQQVID